MLNDMNAPLPESKCSFFSLLRGNFAYFIENQYLFFCAKPVIAYVIDEWLTAANDKYMKRVINKNNKLKIQKFSIDNDLAEKIGWDGQGNFTAVNFVEYNSFFLNFEKIFAGIQPVKVKDKKIKLVKKINENINTDFIK
ncbi:hypothetical protein Flexsi_0439 [Flexistipes sinusarabici DSM 4947]|uniref:Uncharacterized protein n=1 Tax=Flexistipes sinusarabici (strain ATCC 49648 / DSM 4947 / MAS 10) TaxID=717231 RepID=F8E903_FLESM|nr:hypothetical protein [Flexistipes sinusarabici]AEI14127.1 hypothetical protein Flexsi_0439 [Flexistipes sinusarabici DSM 4947]